MNWGTGRCVCVCVKGGGGVFKSSGGKAKK